MKFGSWGVSSTQRSFPGLLLRSSKILTHNCHYLAKSNPINLVDRKTCVCGGASLPMGTMLLVYVSFFVSASFQSITFFRVDGF